MQAKVVNKIAANRIQQHEIIYMYIKYMHHDRMEFISGLLGWFSIQKRIGMFHRFNRVKKENHVIAINAENKLDKIQHPHVLKLAKKKKGIEPDFLSLLTSIYKKPTVDILNGEKLSTLDQARMSALTIIKHIGESPSQCTKPRKGNKGPQLRKEETKLFQFLYAMIVSVRNPMEFIHTN